MPFASATMFPCASCTSFGRSRLYVRVRPSRRRAAARPRADRTAAGPVAPPPAGGLRGLNRAGIHSSGSPYLKMSFETCAAFLVDALMTGARDNLRSPSARLVMGRVVDAGTGACDLWAPL